MSLEYKQNFSDLMASKITPASIVGRGGYKYPKSVASSWLLKQIHNNENPNCKVSECFVMTSGKPFPSEVKAMQSTQYQSLLSGTPQLLADRAYVSDYGVMPSPCGNGGYIVYVDISYTKH
ncbi:MAG: hypothetical protein ACI9T7_000136 [Oleiphilaceae bacterium]|jgi:hypothetical protein